MICLETKAWSGERGFNRERKRKGRKTRERRKMLEGKEKILKGVKWRAKRLSGKFGACRVVGCCISDGPFTWVG